MMIGTMKSGIPIYEAMKSPVLQFPFRKTGKPVIKVMMVDPMKPYHAVKGWKGLFQGKLSRLSPCAFIAAWKRMKQKHNVAHAIKPATVLRLTSHPNACAAPPSPRLR